MTGIEYIESYDEAYIKELLSGLIKLGPKMAVITGVSLSKGKTGVYGYDTEKKEYFIYQNDRVDASYHGTGDLFSSIAVGSLMRGLSVKASFKIAADHTADTIRETLKNPGKPWYGVDFETTMPDLIYTLNESLKSS